MPENHTMLSMVLLSLTLGYLACGWMAVLGCLMAWMDELKKKRWFRLAHGAEANTPARRAHLEALLAKAYLLNEVCRDTYGARNRCLEIIGQTDKYDPLFIKACDLYLDTATAGKPHGAAIPGNGAPTPSCAPDLISLPGRGKVISFPLTHLRR